MRNLFLLFIFFTFLSFSYSLNPSELSINYLLGLDQDSPAYQMGISTYVGAFSLLVVLFLSVGYAIGKGFNIPTLIVFVEEEASHLLFTFVLLLLIASLTVLFSFVINWIYDSAAASYSSHFSAQTIKGMNPEIEFCISRPSFFAKVRCSLIKMKSLSFAMYKSYLKKSLKERQRSATAYTFMWPGIGSSTTPVTAAKRGKAMFLESIINMILSPVYISLSVQSLLYNYITDFSLGVFLPMGFLFRFTPWTRSFGNILIAIGFGLGTLLPMVYSVGVLGFFYIPHEDLSFANDTHYLGSDVGLLGAFLVQAFFVPNLALVVFISFASSMSKALSVIG